MVKQFGVLVSFTINDIDVWDAYAIADRAFVEVRGTEQYKTVLICRTADIFKPGQLPNDEYRATEVNVSGSQWGGGYYIVGYERDGTGISTLILEAQA